MKQYAVDYRQLVYHHDWNILLQHEPVKSFLQRWIVGTATLYNKAKTTEDYVNITSKALSKMGPRQCLHHGRDHTTTTTNVCRASPYLLTILWMLRYCIHDQKSLDNFIAFLSPNKFPPPPGSTECTFLHINFFQDYILIPITDIVVHLIESTTLVSKTRTILLETFIQDPSVHFPKTTEFMLYSLASTFIEIILTNGSTPTFLHSNKNTNEIKKFLNKNVSDRQAGDSNIFRSTDLYELFFSSLPYLIEKHVKMHWQLIFHNFIRATKQPATMFGPQTTLTNFELQLPFEDETKKFIALSLKEFFEAIRSGKMSLQDIIGDQKNKRTEEEGITSNREKKKVDYTESGGENDDDDDIEVKSPTKTRKKNINVKEYLQMTDDQYIGIKNNIRNKSRKLLDMIGKHDTNFPEMYSLLTSVTASADNMFECLDTTFDGDDDKKPAARKRKRST